MSARRTRRGLALRLAALSAAVILAFDVAVSRFVIPDGVYVWKPLPPFGACMTAEQRAWLAREQDELARGVEAGLTRFDAELGWCTVPGRATPAGVRPSFSYTSQGTRSTREHAPRPADGVVRLACFGESFTHGDEVADADTWQARLEALEPRFEALNFGVGGYGSDQALLRMRREGLHGSQVACLGFMVENIGRNVNRYRPFYQPTTPSCVVKPRFVLRDGRLELVPQPYPTLANLVAAIADGRVTSELARHEHWIAETRWSWAAPSSLLRFATGWWAYLRREAPRMYADPAGEPYRTTLALLSAFDAEARQKGAQDVVVLVFPARSQLASSARDGRFYWQPLVDDLRERGVAVLDLTPTLLAARRAAPDGEGRDPLFNDSHYSPYANTLVAEALRDWLSPRFPPP